MTTLVARGGNATTNGSAVVLVEGLGQDLAIYDKLPPRVQRALQTLPFKFSSILARDFLAQGYSEDAVIGGMVKESMRIHTVDVAKGLPGIAP